MQIQIFTVAPPLLLCFHMKIPFPFVLVRKKEKKQLLELFLRQFWLTLHRDGFISDFLSHFSDKTNK